jgi:anti-sigma28 factor (negative regulator of flagellin synthesis)
MTGSNRESGRDLKHPAPIQESGQDTVTQLKRQIAARTYRVDSQAVAREMLFKLRMMALLRNQQRGTSQFRG